MKSVSDNFAARFSSFGASPDAYLDESLLSRIGEDLRLLYDDVTETELPRGLLDLAEAIDARRMGSHGRD